MPTITKSIGASGKDYTTITLWEADLDNDTPYDAGDVAVGECYNEVYDESFALNGGNTLGLASVTLSVAAGERHDGTAGTGARIDMSVDRAYSIEGVNRVYTIEWLEFDWNGNHGSGDWHVLYIYSNDANNVHFIKNCLIHDILNNNGSNHSYVMSVGLGRCNGLNNIFYDLSASVNNVRTISTGSLLAYTIANNTIFNITNSGAGTAVGLRGVNDADHTYKNNICMVCDDGDFVPGGTNPTSDYNMSSDATADDGGGASNLINKAAANQFVSTVGGSEDLHLKAGADAIDAGIDLVTTPTGVNIDINGRDRDALGDIWDMGAHEYVAAAPSIYIPRIMIF